MISYKIITQELYDYLAKLSLDIPSQRSLLIQSNTELILKVEQLQERATTFEVQLGEEKSKKHELLSQLSHLQSKLNQMSQKIVFQTQHRIKSDKEKNETAILLENALKQKTQILANNSNLISRLSALQSGIIVLNQKNETFQQKQKLLQSKNLQMHQTINAQNDQKLNLLSKLHQKQQAFENVNSHLTQNAESLQKVLTQYQACKEEKQGLQVELQKYIDSPVPKLLQKINSNQIWIAQLTKTINELRQRCVGLEMDRPSYHVNAVPSFPYSSKAPLYMRPNTSYSPQIVAPYIQKLSTQNQKVQAVPNIAQQTFFTNRSRFEEVQRLKYLTICKQLVQQFNTKLSKIQQQKKSMQEKFQTLKLRLNEYQYNEFKYKDKISLYLKKIQRYEKLTEKQQSEMENFILQFDQELNNVVRMKEEEVRSRLEEQISNYQAQLQRLKEQEELTKKLEEQAYQELIKHEANADDFDYEMLKRLLEHTEQQLGQKLSQLQTIRNNLNTKTKELQKYKQSKQSYKKKFITLQEQCYDNSIEIRRLKGIIQELFQELETKSNENLMLRSTLLNGDTHLTNRSNEDSRLKYGEEFNENSSAKISLNKNVSAGKRSGSEKFEYQFSQIDVELQKRNDIFLNQIVIKRKQQFQNFVSNTPAGPSRVSQHSEQVPNSQPYWTRTLKPSIKDSQDSINKSQISSQSQNQQNREKELNSGTNSPISSYSSKNSYQSYGIRNLYKEKTTLIQNWGQRFLHHKNSLQ